MDTTTVAHPAHRQGGDTREQRALELYRTRGHEIKVIGEDTFEVPSCTGSHTYQVSYGASNAREERCSCPDFGFGHTCKHLLSVGIMHAARRSGIREIRITAAAAGDPFSYAGKTAPCAGCGRRGRRRDLVECVEDNHDNLTYFHGDQLCPTCADNAGVEY